MSDSPDHLPTDLSFGPDGVSINPPGWALKTPDGEPFILPPDLSARVEFVVYHNDKAVGTGYLQPNGSLGLN